MDHKLSNNNDDLSPFQSSRRHFLSRAGTGLGVAALGSLLPGCLGSSDAGLAGLGQKLSTHHVAKAKRIIYLFQSGGPAQMELFDYKPLLTERKGEELPDSVRMGQRLTGMTADQKAFPLQGNRYDFKQHGQSGAWVSDLLPHTSKIVDDLGDLDGPDDKIRGVFFTILNRFPSDDEIKIGREMMEDFGEDDGISDLTWALMNSPEFLFIQ